MRKFMAVSWMTQLILLFSLALVAILGCNAKPYDYQPTAGEMKEGPGLLTGEDGELTVYDSSKGGAFPRNSDAPEAGTTGGKTAATTTAAGTAAAGSQDHAGEFREFQEYQQWKKEKEQFHQYQQWKKSTAGSADYKEFQEYQQWQKSGKNSADYKEFQEWREFKSYQEWKKRQNN